MKAVLHFRASPALRRRVEAAVPEWLEVRCVDEADEAGLAEALQDAEVLLHVLSPVSERHLAGAPALKLVQKIGVGLNTIDLQAAAARGIRVANMPGTNSRAVCEATVALMLAVLRRLTPLHAVTSAGRGWSLPTDAMDDVGELAGRTVGLVGFGSIPRLLVPILQAFGAEVQFWSRSEVPGAPVSQVDLQALVRTSDIVSLHLPLTPETRHIVNATALAAMRPGAILVNTARGPLVDEAALVRALASGRLRGAGLDVFEEEPTPASNPLLAMPQVVLTPHVAWLTSETLDRSLAVIVENCTRLRDGGPLLHEIKLARPAA
jgi:phosphoglycerate dehydrogenase-like enzyme